MKILVTGGKGFLGKQLCNFLFKNGHEAVSFDLVDKQNLLDNKLLEKSLNNIDYIIHLAAVGDVYKAIKKPTEAIISGIAGTTNLIFMANKFSIKKIIYASTWEIYGKPLYQPIDENHPCQPYHPYSIAKYGGELIIRNKFNRIPWVILRLGSLYGHNMRNNTVISLFIDNAFKKKPIIIQGIGNQFRQYIHVNDVNKVLLKILSSKVKNDIFNLVGNEMVKIKDLAHLITKKLPTKIIFQKERLGDPSSAIISNNKISRRLKWKPEAKFEKEIINIINNKLQ